MKNDPWRNRNQSNQEPPDIDAAIKDLFKQCKMTVRHRGHYF